MRCPGVSMEATTGLGLLCSIFLITIRAYSVCDVPTVDILRLLSFQ